MFKYGLNDEMNFQSSDDGMTFYSSDEGNNVGVPKTLKSGLYYTDKLNKNSKITVNYTYTNTELRASTQTRSQYFLADSNYTTTNSSETFRKNENHTLNFMLTQKLDSLTELEIKPRIKANINSTSSNSSSDFISNIGDLTRRSDTQTDNTGKAFDINTNVKLKHNFLKKERQLIFTYDLEFSNTQTNGILKSDNTSYIPSVLPNASINQQKTGTSGSQSHSASLIYTEPITPKIKLEFSYDFLYNTGSQDKKTLDYYNGDYSLKDSLFTNNFVNTRITNRAGAKFIYEVKKQRFSVGARVREVAMSNQNLITDQQITQVVNNVLPNAGYLYKFSDNRRLSFQYYTDSKQPSINQLQPVPDNSNPNQVRLGNPDLVPTFNHSFSTYFNSYKPITGSSIWSSLFFSTVNNDFSNAITYDNIGRTITRPVNVNGNYNGSANLNFSLPLFSKWIDLSPNMNGSYSNNTNYINGQKNNTRVSSTGGGLRISHESEKFSFSLSSEYDYNSPASTLNTNSNLPYSSQIYGADMKAQLPWKLFFETDGAYTINSRRTLGYNINFFLWNASFGRNFLKNENLSISVAATDLLNQNISTNRFVNDNIITDTKTNVIGRYIMLKIVFKFNSTKTKEENEGF